PVLYYFHAFPVAGHRDSGVDWGGQTEIAIPNLADGRPETARVAVREIQPPATRHQQDGAGKGGGRFPSDGRWDRFRPDRSNAFPGGQTHADIAFHFKGEAVPVQSLR